MLKQLSIFFLPKKYIFSLTKLNKVDKRQTESPNQNCFIIVFF